MRGVKQVASITTIREWRQLVKQRSLWLCQGTAATTTLRWLHTVWLGIEMLLQHDNILQAIANQITRTNGQAGDGNRRELCKKARRERARGQLQRAYSTFLVKFSGNTPRVPSDFSPNCHPSSTWSSGFDSSTWTDATSKWALKTRIKPWRKCAKLKQKTNVTIFPQWWQDLLSCPSCIQGSAFVNNKSLISTKSMAHLSQPLRSTFVSGTKWTNWERENGIPFLVSQASLPPSANLPPFPLEVTELTGFGLQIASFEKDTMVENVPLISWQHEWEQKAHKRWRSMPKPVFGSTIRTWLRDPR